MSWQHWLFAAAGVLAIAVIAIEPWCARRKIIVALRARPAAPDDARERWGRVHLAADRRAPFHIPDTRERPLRRRLP